MFKQFNNTKKKILSLFLIGCFMGVALIAYDYFENEQKKLRNSNFSRNQIPNGNGMMKNAIFRKGTQKSWGVPFFVECMTTTL